jgi:hypothetical protein
MRKRETVAQGSGPDRGYKRFQRQPTGDGLNACMRRAADGVKSSSVTEDNAGLGNASSPCADEGPSACLCPSKQPDWLT